MESTRRPLIALVLVSLAAVACAKTGDQAFRARAAQDLGCPEGDLYIEHKWEGDEASKRASGCGKEALYVRECQHEGCLWKLQTATDTGTTTDTGTDTGSATSTDTAAATTQTSSATATATSSATAP
ncbi:MAG TPA: hypothetical protein PLU22_23635 [Polyangiaceae bacterium]|nr:hypothetical protein [Polyangiaceae bacterium]